MSGRTSSGAARPVQGRPAAPNINLVISIHMIIILITIIKIMIMIAIISYMCMYVCITILYIYIYICILSSSRKRPGVFFYGFHRRDSRGPVAAGDH